MQIDLDKARKPFRKLRKLVKAISPETPPEQIHDLRTSCRKVEATLHSLPNQGGRRGRGALKRIKPLRRVAGEIRDMDELMGKAAPLCTGPDCKQLVCLLEDLSAQRKKADRKLSKLVRKRGSRIVRVLKQAQKGVDRASESASGKQPSAPAQALAERLQHWPPLHHDNLHDFRKGVKELRYTLQIFGPADEAQLNAYGKVKDAVGEWHDWLELKHAAEKVFCNAPAHPVLRQIREQARRRLRQAMTAANGLREQGFQIQGAE